MAIGGWGWRTMKNLINFLLYRLSEEQYSKIQEEAADFIHSKHTTDPFNDNFGDYLFCVSDMYEAKLKELYPRRGMFK